jgi:hypothetical protein
MNLGFRALSRNFSNRASRRLTIEQFPSETLAPRSMDSNRVPYRCAVHTLENILWIGGSWRRSCRLEILVVAKTFMLQSSLWTSPVWNVIASLGVIASAAVAAWAARQAQRSADAAFGVVQESKHAVDASQRAADIMETEMRLSQRAWVGIRNVRWVPPLTSSNIQPSIELELENRGSSPALNVRLTFHLELSRNRMDESNLREGDKDGCAEKPIPPGASFSCWRHVDHALTDAEMRDLRNRLIHIYVFGVLEYEDIFGQKHATEWALEFNPSVAGDLSPLYYHNTMT